MLEGVCSVLEGVCSVLEGVCSVLEGVYSVWRGYAVCGGDVQCVGGVCSVWCVLEGGVQRVEGHVGGCYQSKMDSCLAILEEINGSDYGDVLEGLRNFKSRLRCIFETVRTDTPIISAI